MCLVPCSRVVLMRTQHVEYSSYTPHCHLVFPHRLNGQSFTLPALLNTHKLVHPPFNPVETDLYEYTPALTPEVSLCVIGFFVI